MIGPDLSTVVLLHVSCTGSLAAPNITTKSRRLDRRGVTSDVRFRRVYDEFPAQPVLVVQDCQLLTVSKHGLVNRFAQKRYLYDLGIAKKADDVGFRKPYAYGNGVRDCWFRSSEFSHLGNQVIEFSHVVKWHAHAGPKNPFDVVGIDDFDFTEVTLAHVLTACIRQPFSLSNQIERPVQEQTDDADAGNRPGDLRNFSKQTISKEETLIQPFIMRDVYEKLL